MKHRGRVRGRFGSSLVSTPGPPHIFLKLHSQDSKDKWEGKGGKHTKVATPLMLFCND